MRRVLPVLLILALLVCCLPFVSVRAAAADASDYVVPPGTYVGSIRMSIYDSGFSNSYYPFTESVYNTSSCPTTFIGYFGYRSSTERYYYYVPVGDLDNYSLTVGFRFEQLGSSAFSGYSSSYKNSLQLHVSCYDSSFNLLGQIFINDDVAVDSSFTCYTTVYGNMLYSGTEYITFYFCANPDTDDFGFYKSGFNSTYSYGFYCQYYNVTPFIYSDSSLGVVKTQSADSVDYSTPEFNWSHQDMYVNFYDGCDSTMSVVVRDWVPNLSLSARLNILCGSNTYSDTVELLYSESDDCFYNIFDFHYELLSDSSFVANVEFLLDDTVVYTSPFSYFTVAGGSGGSGDSGESSGSTDSAVMDLLEEVDVSIYEVQTALSDVHESIDSVSEQVGAVQDQLEGVQDSIEEGNSILGDISDGITSLPERIMDGIKGLFVPDEEEMAGIKDQWSELLADRFGAVYESVVIIDDFVSAFTDQGVQDTITFPSVTIPLSGVDFTLGGWEVDVVPDGFEFLIEVLKKFIDIVCTLMFLNGMKNRYERALEGRE